jgi:hypothetical protein
MYRVSYALRYTRKYNILQEAYALFSVVFLNLPQDKERKRGRCCDIGVGGGGLEPNKKTVQKAWAYSTLLPLCTALHSCEDNLHVPLLQTLFCVKIVT